MPKIDPFARIRDRKEDYIEHTTSIQWIGINMLRWGHMLPKIELSIGFNVSFNFLLDFYLAMDLHFPFDAFDFNMPNFVGDWYFPSKAYYGKTRYSYSLYDPPEILWTDLARFIWNMRYHTTEKSIPDYKGMAEALRQYIETHKDILIKKGVSEKFIQALIETLLKVEGKILNSGYVGYSVVGVARVMKKVPRRRYIMGDYRFRWTDDYKTEKQGYTRYPYETQVGYCRVNYARVIPIERVYKDTHLRPLSKDLVQRVKEFKMRSCKTPITKGLDVEVRPEVREITKHIEPPKYTLYQRIFFYQKREKMQWQGGKHQARLQHIIERVKQVLDKYGIHGTFRLGYIAFAKEYVYMNYKPHRRWKRWRRLLTKDDLIEKYKRMGLDEEVLNEVLKVVETFKVVADMETPTETQT